MKTLLTYTFPWILAFVQSSIGYGHQNLEEAASPYRLYITGGWNISYNVNTLNASTNLIPAMAYSGGRLDVSLQRGLGKGYAIELGLGYGYYPAKVKLRFNDLISEPRHSSQEYAFYWPTFGPFLKTGVTKSFSLGAKDNKTFIATAGIEFQIIEETGYGNTVQIGNVNDPQTSYTVFTTDPYTFDVGFKFLMPVYYLKLGYSHSWNNKFGVFGHIGYHNAFREVTSSGYLFDHVAIPEKNRFRINFSYLNVGAGVYFTLDKRGKKHT